jgi:hypothetical protein
MFGAALLGGWALVIAVGALAVVGSALTSLLAPQARGLTRGLATVVLAAAAAVLEALMLGRLGLGGSPAALTLLALASAGLAWRLCPSPAVGPLAELLGSLRRATRLGLAGWGALGGALLALVAIELHRPVLGQDAITYHLPEVVGWVQSGHTGRVLNEFYGLAVGNYPVTEEVLLAWATGITHGFSAALVLTVATLALLLAAGWLGLQELRISRAVRGLALAALLLVPLIVQAWVEPGTDLEAMTWLVCCGALCLAARQDPGLLAAALVAGGLAVGTKTTVLSYVVVILIITTWHLRHDLRAHARALLAAAALVGLTGLLWYLRNWVDHGSPLWPFSSFPGGDPRPQIISYLSTSLLENFRATLLDHLHGYVSGLSGAVVLILVTLATTIAAVALRRRRLLIAGLVVAAGSLEYAAGPVTGLPPGGTLLVAVVGSTLRYLMPVFAAATVALALAAADRDRRLAAVGCLALTGALIWDLVSDLPDHFFLGYDSWLWPGILLGALLLPALSWVVAHPGAPDRGCSTDRPSATPPVPTRRERVVAALGATTLAGLTAVLLAAGATHFAFRHAITSDYAQGVSIFLLTQPGYTDTHVPVATSRTGLAQLAGDRLQHPLSLIPQHAGCDQVRRLHQHDWIVIGLPLPPAVLKVIPAGVSPSGSAPGCLTRSGALPEYRDASFAVYAPLQS